MSPDRLLRSFLPQGVISCWVPGPGKRARDIIGGKDGSLIGGVIPQVAMKTRGPNLLSNGNLESWASDTDCNGWTENVSGASTVNREDSGQHRGLHCARIDSDGSGTEAYIRQSPSMSAGKLYLLSFWHKVQSGAHHRNLIRITLGGFSYYLQGDGTWKKSGDSGFDYFFTGTSLTNTTWGKFGIYFRLPAGFSGQIIGLGSCYTEISKSIYVDDAELYEVSEGPIETDLGWSFDGINGVIQTTRNTPSGAVSVGFWARRTVHGTTFNPAISMGGGTDETPSFLTTRFLSDVYNPVAWLGGTNWRYWSDHDPVSNNRPGEWVFYVFCLPGGAKADLESAICYLNGQVQGDTDTHSYAGDQSARTTVVIGKCASNYYKGDLAMPFVANRMLSQQGVLNIFRETKGFFLPR